MIYSPTPFIPNIINHARTAKVLGLFDHDDEDDEDEDNHHQNYHRGPVNEFSEYRRKARIPFWSEEKQEFIWVRMDCIFELNHQTRTYLDLRIIRKEGRITEAEYNYLKQERELFWKLQDFNDYIDSIPRHFNNTK